MLVLWNLKKNINKIEWKQQQSQNKISTKKSACAIFYSGYYGSKMETEFLIVE